MAAHFSLSLLNNTYYIKSKKNPYAQSTFGFVEEVDYKWAAKEVFFRD